MKRLTRNLISGSYTLNCEECELNNLTDCTALNCRQRLQNRLAKYENIGYTPEQLDDFARQACEIRTAAGCKTLGDCKKLLDEQRLLVLPCKIGTPVYMIWQFGGNAEVIEVTFDYEDIPDFGKTVFLTKKEAQTALKKAGG